MLELSEFGQNMARLVLLAWSFSVILPDISLLSKEVNYLWKKVSLLSKCFVTLFLEGHKWFCSVSLFSNSVPPPGFSKLSSRVSTWTSSELSGGGKFRTHGKVNPPRGRKSTTPVFILGQHPERKILRKLNGDLSFIMGIPGNHVMIL